MSSPAVPEPRTSLYLITADNADGENLDQLIEALCGGDAVLVWLKEVGEESGATIDDITHVFLLPNRTGRAHVLSWHLEVCDVRKQALESLPARQAGFKVDSDSGST